MSAANALSALRIPLAAAFLLVEATAARAAILALGGVSDWVDGWLARRTGTTSRLGELLDPVADKIFALTVVGVLWAEGRLPLWAVALLLVRDVYTALGLLLARLLRFRLRGRARLPGKITTGLQVGTLLAALLWPSLVPPLAVATGVAGLVAVVDYTRAATRGLRSARDTP